MYKVKRTINFFINPELLKKFILGEKYDGTEIILDPSQLEGIEEIRFDMRWRMKHFEKLLQGKIVEHDAGEFLVEWELVNCTPEDKMRLIHVIDQHLLVKTND